MKRLRLGLVLCVAMMFAGCEEASTPGQVQALAAQYGILQQQFDAIQEAAGQMTEDLVTDEIVDTKIVAKVAKLNKEADRIQAQIAVIAQALQGVSFTGVPAQDWVTMLQTANVASSGFNPYVAPIGSGLVLLNILLGWLAKRKAAEAAAAQLKYQAHKQGVQKTMKEVSGNKDTSAEIEVQLYNNIGEARKALGV